MYPLPPFQKPVPHLPMNSTYIFQFFNHRYRSRKSNHQYYQCRIIPISYTSAPAAGSNTRAPLTCQQFKHQYPQGPVVRRDVVAFVQDDFRRYVLRGAAESPGFPSDLDGRGWSVGLCGIWNGMVT